MKRTTALMGRFGQYQTGDDEKLDGTASHHPVSTRADVVPGIDEQLIAREEAVMAIASHNVAARKQVTAAKAAAEKAKEVERKADLREGVLEIACSRDVCQCPGGQRCHLNTHQRGNLGYRQLVTRTSILCMNC